MFPQRGPLSCNFNVLTHVALWAQSLTQKWKSIKYFDKHLKVCHSDHFMYVPI